MGILKSSVLSTVDHLLLHTPNLQLCYCETHWNDWQPKADAPRATSELVLYSFYQFFFPLTFLQTHTHREKETRKTHNWCCETFLIRVFLKVAPCVHPPTKLRHRELYLSCFSYFTAAYFFFDLSQAGQSHRLSALLSLVVGAAFQMIWHGGNVAEAPSVHRGECRAELPDLLVKQKGVSERGRERESRRAAVGRLSASDVCQRPEGYIPA